jgi:hypothetical protein
MRWTGALLVLPVVLIVSGGACFAQALDDASMARLKEQIKEEVLNEIRKEYKLVPKEEAAVVKPEEKYVTEDEVRRVVEEVAEEKEFVTAEWAKGLTFGGLTQRLTLQGFGDVTFRANEGSGRFDSDEDNNFFGLGNLDLFITAQISERISFLTETLFEIEEDGTVLDIERLFIRYEIADCLKVTVGRVHTGLGYWNQTFHHGFWLQTTIDRPDVYAFEDEAGILPIHSVGIELSGTHDFGPFDLDYTFNIANGRGEIVDEVQNVADKNDSKAVGLMVTIKPEMIPGLFFGGNIYHDDIPAKMGAPTHGEIDELIIGGHAGYLYGDWEFLLEGFNIEHDDDVTDREYNTWGAYAQVAYRLDQWKPYYRYDIVQFNKRDPFYLTSFDGEVSDIKRHTIGLRYDIATFNAIKIEYNHLDASEGGNMDSFALNTSFSF